MAALTALTATLCSSVMSGTYGDDPLGGLLLLPPLLLPMLLVLARSAWLSPSANASALPVVSSSKSAGACLATARRSFDDCSTSAVLMAGGGEEDEEEPFASPNAVVLLNRRIC
jgi:hypothetical protein